MTKDLENLLKNKKVLTACHRGAHGGNIIQNTIESCLCAYAQGADIAEIDVVRSIDSEYYVFHDTEESYSFGFLDNLRDLTSEQINDLRLINKYGCRTEQRVPLFRDLLRAVKDKGLLNMDRCWGADFSYMKGALDIICEEDMLEQVIVKASCDDTVLRGIKEYGKNVLFMGIVKSREEIVKIEQSGVKAVGYELIFSGETDDVLSAIPELQRKDRIVWANSIVLNDRVKLSGGRDDVRALLEGKDEAWGWLIERGFNVIQTDYPQALSDYVQKKFFEGRSNY